MSECICPKHITKDKDGYPRVKYNRRNVTVARLIYQLLYGNIPEGRLICHHCDNPACVNPAHLYLGDHKTNGFDKSIRKRIHGNKNPNMKRTDEDCLKMYDAYTNFGITQQRIGKQYGISQSRVSGCIARARKLLNGEQIRAD